ncbi:hypothetical protein HDU87_002691 [Geranomyces variabilis]|uniref:Uncharacterized protein n=1 Tax=Geranomyces variabilis TaxID=109894 RepID=A0AAD5TTN5_9FUNG|nr:hypothetical protein HDU87_002691 [Geranomyces variabilis]
MKLALILLAAPFVGLALALPAPVTADSAAEDAAKPGVAAADVGYGGKNYGGGGGAKNYGSGYYGGGANANAGYAQGEKDHQGYALEKDHLRELCYNDDQQYGQNAAYGNNNNKYYGGGGAKKGGYGGVGGYGGKKNGGYSGAYGGYAGGGGKNYGQVGAYGNKDHQGCVLEKDHIRKIYQDDRQKYDQGYANQGSGGGAKKNGGYYGGGGKGYAGKKGDGYY